MAVALPAAKESELCPTTLFCVSAQQKKKEKLKLLVAVFPMKLLMSMKRSGQKAKCRSRCCKWEFLER